LLRHHDQNLTALFANLDERGLLHDKKNRLYAEINLYFQNFSPCRFDPVQNAKTPRDVWRSGKPSVSGVSFIPCHAAMVFQIWSMNDCSPNMINSKGKSKHF